MSASARRAVILAGLALGCSGGAELVAPNVLVAEAELEEHTVGSETRPAIRLASDTPLAFIAPAAGVLRLGVGPGEASRTQTRLRLGLPGGRSLELAVGRTQRWQDVAPPGRVTRGAELSFTVTGGGEVWLADPRIEAPRTEPTAPLVVVILVDTLRADHTSLDGYALPTARNLEALAADGTAFLRAYVPAPWTRPSAASLLTGLGTGRHHVTGRNDRLRDDVLTFAEIARREGHRTVAIVTNPNVVVGWGFGQGFARFVDLGSEGWTDRKTEAGAVYRRALEILDEEALPLFLFLHVLDPHHPYEPPVELAQRLFPDYREAEPGREIPENAGEALLASAQRRYDGEILDADEALGAFLGALRERGLYEAAAIVVAGDHGEEFGERGGRYHGHTLYEEQLRVPLVMKLPGERPAASRSESLASVLDALPTIADALGWELPADVQGRSLLPAMRGAGPVHERLTAETRLDGAHAYALITADRKLIRQLAPRPATLLFDLVGDPEERMPRYDPEELARLGAVLDRELAGSRAGWHVRACGGASREELAFRIEGLTGEPRFVGFEPADRGEAADGAASVRVAVRRRREWGAPDARPPVPDEDEIVFPGGAIALHPGPGAPPTLLVAGAPQAWAGSVALEPAAALRPSLAPPRCPGGEGATVLAWYVAAPAEEHFAPGAELRRRLEGLGYVVEPESAGER